MGRVSNVGCRIVEEARQPFYDVYILSLWYLLSVTERRIHNIHGIRHVVSASAAVWFSLPLMFMLAYNQLRNLSSPWMVGLCACVRCEASQWLLLFIRDADPEHPEKCSLCFICYCYFNDPTHAAVSLRISEIWICICSASWRKYGSFHWRNWTRSDQDELLLLLLLVLLTQSVMTVWTMALNSWMCITDAAWDILPWNIYSWHSIPTLNQYDDIDLSLDKLEQY